MILDSYIRGVDSIDLELTLTYENTGLPIDIDSLDDVSVELIRQDRAIPLNTVYWSGTILTGEVDIVDADAGLISCHIDPAEHNLWPLIIYHARIKKTETDADFDSGIKTSSYIEEAFRLIKE